MKILHTDRLTLRWFRDEDAPFIVELLHSEGWQRFIGDRGVHSQAEARDWITQHLRAACWRQGFGQWAIERRADGALMGLCGLVRRDKLPAIDVGYALLPRFEGVGHAREAVAATLAYSADALGLPTVLAITRPDNERSIRLLQSLGLGLERSEPLAGDAHTSMVFAWQNKPNAPVSDEAQIDALVQRFYAAFCNANGQSHRVASLPYWFTPDARVHKTEGDRVESFDLPTFLAPRAALLEDGRLTDFCETESHARTEVQGRWAQRTSHFDKRGRLDGQAFVGGGVKQMQFVQTPQGWRISALAWEDRG